MDVSPYRFIDVVTAAVNLYSAYFITHLSLTHHRDHKATCRYAIKTGRYTSERNENFMYGSNNSGQPDSMREYQKA